MLFKFKRKSDSKIFYTNGKIYLGRGAEEHYYLTNGNENLQITELDLINNFEEISIFEELQIGR